MLDYGSGRDNFSALGGAAVWSGATGEILWRWSPPAVSNTLFGLAVSGGNVDIDLDGVPDFAVGDPPQYTISSFSGRDGLPLQIIGKSLIPGPTNYQGVMFYLLPPLRPGAAPRVVSFDFGRLGGTFGGGPCNQPKNCGQVTMFSLEPMGTQRFGAPCQGALPKLPNLGLRARAGTTRVQMSGAEPGGTAVLILGFSRTTWAGGSLPTAMPGLVGCELLVAPDVVVPVSASTGPLGGYAFVDIPLPLNPAGGLTVHGQWVALASSVSLAGGATDALSWRH